MMASNSRGQPPAWHTKVVHQGSGCLKADSTKMMVRMSNGSCYDAIPSKPTCILGRGLADGQQPVSTVTKCGSKRCLICKHISEGSSFTSNITKKKYSPNSDMDCSSRNVIYLISCKKCGVQYIGKTSQTLRSRMNNHRYRLKHMCDLYLYNHFNSDEHFIDDMYICLLRKSCLLLMIRFLFPLSY